MFEERFAPHLCLQLALQSSASLAGSVLNWNTGSFWFISAGKWLACQSMDNQISIYGVHTNFRLNRKKNFRGHMVRWTAIGDYKIAVSFPGSTWEWESSTFCKWWSRLGGAWGLSYMVSLLPRPSWKPEGESGILNDFSCHIRQGWMA